MAASRGEDPRAYADDIHRMGWDEYLQMAEEWKAQRTRWSWRAMGGFSALAVIVVIALLV